MAEAITHVDVVRVAKEVFPGLTDEHIHVEGPDQDTGWCVKISFAPGSASFDVMSGSSPDVATGRGGRLVDVGITTLRTEVELRHFLEACRNSLARNLEAVLAVCLGPVRVLPIDQELDQMSVDQFCRTNHIPGPSYDHDRCKVWGLLGAYADKVMRRRAERAAKPAGS